MDQMATLKILTIGESFVGKTSIIRAFTSGDYGTSFRPTIGVDCNYKAIKVNAVNVKIRIWDTAGMERFRAVTSTIYRGTHGAVFVYDVSKPITLTKLNDWIEEFQFYSTNKNAVCLLVGNKVDKDRAISRQIGEKFARKHRMMFIESSVITKEGIDLAFEELAQKIIETPGLWQTDGLSNICISSEERRKLKKTSCLNFGDCFK